MFVTIDILCSLCFINLYEFTEELQFTSNLYLLDIFGCIQEKNYMFHRIEASPDPFNIFFLTLKL